MKATKQLLCKSLSSLKALFLQCQSETKDPHYSSVNRDKKKRTNAVTLDVNKCNLGKVKLEPMLSAVLLSAGRAPVEFAGTDCMCNSQTHQLATSLISFIEFTYLFVCKE